MSEEEFEEMMREESADELRGMESCVIFFIAATLTAVLFGSHACTTMSTDGTTLPEFDAAMKMTSGEIDAYASGYEDGQRRAEIDAMNAMNASGDVWKEYLK